VKCASRDHAAALERQGLQRDCIFGVVVSQCPKGRVEEILAHRMLKKLGVDRWSGRRSTITHMTSRLRFSDDRTISEE
jgi:DNA-directed RNA polymerase subunit N (RpoN/RPB10)